MMPDPLVDQERVLRDNAAEIARLRSLAAALATALKQQRILWELVDGDLRTSDAHGFCVPFMDLHQPIQHIDAALVRARHRGGDDVTEDDLKAIELRFPFPTATSVNVGGKSVVESKSGYPDERLTLHKLLAAVRDFTVQLDKLSGGHADLATQNDALREQVAELSFDLSIANPTVDTLAHEREELMTENDRLREQVATVGGWVNSGLLALWDDNRADYYIACPICRKAAAPDDSLIEHDAGCPFHLPVAARDAAVGEETDKEKP